MRTLGKVTRCRYSSFDHPKAYHEKICDEFSPFLSSIEVFAYTQQKNNNNHSHSKKLQIEALDDAKYAVFTNVTIADVLDPHFVHDYVKVEGSDLDLLSIANLKRVNHYYYDDDDISVENQLLGDAKKKSFRNIGKATTTTTTTIKKKTNERKNDDIKESDDKIKENEEEDVFCIHGGRFEAQLSEETCNVLGVSGPVVNRNKRGIAINLKSKDFAPGRTTHDRVTENARRMFADDAYLIKSQKLVVGSFEIGSEAREILDLGCRGGNSIKSDCKTSNVSIEKVSKSTGFIKREEDLFKILESFCATIDSERSETVEEQSNLRKVLESIGYAALQSTKKEESKDVDFSSIGTPTYLKTARWSGFLTSKHLRRTLVATQEMISNNEAEFCFVSANAFPNQPAQQKRTKNVGFSGKRKRKNEEQNNDGLDNDESLEQRCCVFILFQNQRYVSFLPAAS